jgi:hypothetical protein
VEPLSNLQPLLREQNQLHSTCTGFDPNRCVVSTRSFCLQDALGPDGVHYSPLGQQLVYQGLLDLIAMYYPELRWAQPPNLLM